MMKNLYIIPFVLISMFSAFTTTAQNNVGIGTTTPNPNAALEIESTNQGLLPPRMNKAQRNSIVAVAPALTIAEGLVIYCTDCGDGELQVYNGTSWKSLNETGCGLSIGDTYQGGIIFYLDASGCHGLISASADQSTGIQWYDGVYTDTYAYANGLFEGDGNCYRIRNSLGQCASCNAPELCLNLILGGYSDWYLPSKYELNLMYLNIGQGNALGLGNVGSFGAAHYWSSTELNSTNVWSQVFGGGGQSTWNKANTHRVRAVRAF